MASFFRETDRFTQKICEALGENGRNVCGITLQIRAGSIAQVGIARYLTEDELAAIADAYETEGMTLAEGETTYYLEPKSKASEE
jgi:hypothetical protein